MKWLVGIDEVGRGPLAGPVSVGVVKVPIDFDWSLLPPVGDSKTLKVEHRHAVFKSAVTLRRHGVIDFTVKHSPATLIDNTGIVRAINRALTCGLFALDLSPADCFLKLDGSLFAPAPFAQETIIHGDAYEPVIGLASIVAKIIRDRLMVRYHARYPVYEFAAHKGYGTKRHQVHISQYGLSPIHRSSYCKKFVYPLQ